MPTATAHAAATAALVAECEASLARYDAAIERMREVARDYRTMATIAEIESANVAAEVYG